MLASPKTLLASTLLPTALLCAGPRASPADCHPPRDTQLGGSGEARVPGSSLRGQCGAERGSFALSGPCEEEVCWVNSSRQVNSGQMGPRSLPGDTRQAGFAQPRRLFALGRAFPSTGRQQRCWDVTPSSLAGLLHHPPGWVPASGVWALLWHSGDGRLCSSLCHQPGDRGLTSHSQGSVWCPGSSTTAGRARGSWSARQRWGRGAGCTSWPCQTPLLWGEGLLLSPHLG